jgi:PmbA protein
MTDNRTIEYCLEALTGAGATKAQCVLTKGTQYEMNIESGELSLLRTTFRTGISLTGIKDGKKGELSINKVTKDSIDEGVKTVMDLLESAEKDEAVDISPYQVPKEFTYGETEPDLDKMYLAMKDFSDTVKKLYPLVNVMEAQLTFNRGTSYFANSNGVNFKESRGSYNFVCVFASMDKEKSSSFNYTSCSIKKIEKALLELGTVNNLLKESLEQLATTALEGKFVGDIIITPDCLGDFINYYLNTFLSDGPLISGTSLLKDKLEEQIANSKLTLHSHPISNELCDGYFVTPDGFEAKNITLIDKGILKSFLISQYGANKTKLQRAKNSGDAYIIEAGDKNLQDIIGSTKKGILVSRFSGGSPSSNGDFSGVAKNSYYIEDGEIKDPVSETMISGNLLDVFTNIKEISKETINFGSAILPWLSSSNITISGK